MEFERRAPGVQLLWSEKGRRRSSWVLEGEGIRQRRGHEGVDVGGFAADWRARQGTDGQVPRERPSLSSLLGVEMEKMLSSSRYYSNVGRDGSFVGDIQSRLSELVASMHRETEGSDPLCGQPAVEMAELNRVGWSGCIGRVVPELQGRTTQLLRLERPRGKRNTHLRRRPLA